MKNTYYDLVNQTFDFPQDGFSYKDNKLYFNDIDILALVKKYGSPLKLTYLPKIGEKIQMARKLFRDAMQRYNYNGKYVYCYCTKSSHFAFVLNEVLEHGTQLETSSAFDIDLVWRLYKLGKINKGTTIVNNGYKPYQYAQKIANLINEGFENVIPVCDNPDELERYEALIKKDAVCNIGIRMATEEEPNFEFYTSRLGIRQSEVMRFYQERVAPLAVVETAINLVALAALPEALRRDLADALVTLNTERIDELIGRVAERDAALGQFFRRYADNFDFGLIEEVLRGID